MDAKFDPLMRLKSLSQRVSSPDNARLPESLEERARLQRHLTDVDLRLERRRSTEIEPQFPRYSSTQQSRDHVPRSVSTAEFEVNSLKLRLQQTQAILQNALQRNEALETDLAAAKRQAFELKQSFDQERTDFKHRILSLENALRSAKRRAKHPDTNTSAGAVTSTRERPQGSVSPKPRPTSQLQKHQLSDSLKRTSLSTKAVRRDATSPRHRKPKRASSSSRKPDTLNQRGPFSAAVGSHADHRYAARRGQGYAIIRIPRDLEVEASHKPPGADDARQIPVLSIDLSHLA